MKLDIDHKILFNILIGLVAILVFLDANMFFHYYAKTHVDGDQTLFWLFAKDLSEGYFYSPYLYGQNYNIPLESFLAAPLLVLGLSPEMALPLVCMLLMLLPFVFLSMQFYKSKYHSSSILALMMPLLLPTEWLMITSAPRGFVGGIFIAALGMYIASRSSKNIPRSIGYSLSLLAVLINPNAAVILLPFGLYHLFHHRIRWKQFIIPLGVLLLGIMALSYFKSGNDALFIHRAWTIEWSFVDLKINLMHFNDLFKGVIPLVYEIGALIILLLAFFIFYAFRKGDKQMQWLTVSFAVFLFITLGVNKVKDGTASVFFPYSRMYLGVPLVLLLFYNEIERLGGRKFNLKNATILFVLLGASFWLKQDISKDRLNRAFKTNSGVVQLTSTEELYRSIDQFNTLMDQEKAKLLVFDTKVDAYTYGASVISDLRTIHPIYERRQWLIGQESQTPLSDVLIIDWTEQIPERFPDLNVQRLNESKWPVYRITDEGLFMKDIYPSIFAK